jgi:hypothetical protein
MKKPSRKATAGLSLVTGLLVGSGTVAYFSGPETEPVSTVNCGGDKHIELDSTHNPMAIRVEYKKEIKDADDRAFTGFVRLALAEGLTHVTATADMTQAQAMDPLRAELDTRLTTEVRADQGQKENWYPGVPDAVMPFIGGDEIKAGRVDVQVDLHGNENGHVDAGVTAVCTGVYS